VLGSPQRQVGSHNLLALGRTHTESYVYFRYPDIQRVWGYVAEIRRNESGHVQRVLNKSFAGVAVLPLQTREVSFAVISF
jgi:hypothetical protein